MIVRHRQGFTLIEMIIAIVLTGIVVSMVGLFIRQPIQAYFDVAHRAEITDTADTAIRRIVRDVHSALPNSIRQPDTSCLEFLPTKTGGRYRADVPGVPLLINTAITSFDFIGALSATPVAGDRVVVDNEGSTGRDAYSGNNVATVTAATASSITFNPMTFTSDSPGHRFHVIPKDGLGVTYVCSLGSPAIDANGDGTGVLVRYANYGIIAAAPATCPAIPAGTPVLARNVSSCRFTYASGVTERSGLVSIRLGLTMGNETATIFNQVHVNNAP